MEKNVRCSSKQLPLSSSSAVVGGGPIISVDTMMGCPLTNAGNDDRRVKTATAATKWKSAIALLAVCLTLNLAGCKYKMKPTFPGNRVAAELREMCARDYHLSVQTRQEGRTLQAFFWRIGLMEPGQGDMKREAAEALEQVLLCATRISLSTDADLEFIEIKAADVLTGSSVTLWRYVPDILDSMRNRMGEKEYIDRLVIEMDAQPMDHQNPDHWVRWDPPITLAEFLAKQVVLRAKRDSPVSLQLHEELSKSPTLVMVVDNWPVITPPEKAKVTEFLEKTTKDIFHAYGFSGFRGVVLQDGRGMPLGSWAI